MAEEAFYEEDLPEEAGRMEEVDGARLLQDLVEIERTPQELLVGEMFDVLPPVRCSNCGNVLGIHWNRYQTLLSQGRTPEEAFQILGLKRYCCRSNMLNPIHMPIFYPFEKALVQEIKQVQDPPSLLEMEMTTAVLPQPLPSPWMETREEEAAEEEEGPWIDRPMLSMPTIVRVPKKAKGKEPCGSRPVLPLRKAEVRPPFPSPVSLPSPAFEAVPRITELAIDETIERKLAGLSLAPLETVEPTAGHDPRMVEVGKGYQVRVLPREIRAI